MTKIEGETYRDGFRVGLVCVRLEAGRVVAGVEATIFDGGREGEVFARHASGPLPSADYLDLRRFLARLAAPPHVLAVYGAGWRPLLTDCLAEHLPAYRILDLRLAAIRLGEGLPAGADADAIGQAYGIAWRDERQGLTVPWAAELLWAVIAAAGRQGLDWPTLLHLANREALRVSFDRFGFTEDTLRNAPLCSGVYVMRDRAGAVLYVGKAACLQRRLLEYFRPSSEIPSKLRTLRDRIHELELHPVGSELEAILQEQRWISALRPAVNTQRTVAEGRSRYAAPAGPVLMLTPSTQAGCIELFGFARGRPGFQLRLRLSRPARGSLAAAIDVLTGKRRAVPKRPHLTDWGAEGAELMHRYFGRARDRIAWLEVHRDEPPLAFILSAGQAVLSEPPEAAEFREG